MNAGVCLQRQNILFDFKCVIKCVIIRVWSTSSIRRELHTLTHEVQYTVCSVCVIREFSCLGILEACSLLSESVQESPGWIGPPLLSVETKDLLGFEYQQHIYTWTAEE